jgi:uncharacterized protein (DUF2267 family)
MDRKELLTMVKESAGLDNLRQADAAVRVIVGLLKTMLPEEVEDIIAEKLPPDLRAGWELVETYPADIMEREEMYFEGEQGEEGQPYSTITNG